MFTNLYIFAESLLSSLKGSFSWVNVIELIFIALISLLFYKKFIKHTPSESLVKGLLFLIVAWILSEVLILINLKILGVFFKALVTLISLSLIVVFQPELRRFLGYLGEPGFLKRFLFKKGSFSSNAEKDTNVIKEIIEAVKYLTKTKTGALIVFQKALSNIVYPEVGTRIDARVTAELILTIFHPNTPLHDGALVIEKNRIYAAGVLLPLTEDPKLSWKYGTRHRAAIGMSEISDAACLVVSEETGDVSVCLDGVLKKYEDLTTLKTDLESILGIKQAENEQSKSKNIFERLRKDTI